MKNNDDSLKSIIVLFVIVFAIYLLPSISSMLSIVDNKEEDHSVDNYSYSDSVFSIITTPENKELESTINNYFSDKGVEVKITYADNLEIVSAINSGRKYDAIWSSNSIWLYMLDSSVKTSNLRSTSITPIVFGIKKSKAASLGLINKDVTMNDLLKLIQNKELNFSMANPVTTNSGASAYLNILSTLAGNPEVLTMDYLNDGKLKDKLITFFTGLTRTSGDENFLEESFINGDYDAAVTYESSIISINKKLVASGKEPLYLIYPVDGVSICDSPLVFVNNGNQEKEDIFLEFQAYVMSEDGQKILTTLGRRTWYGGISDNVNKNIFNPDWGIDTTKYISPVKYPSKEVIRQALYLYQTELRKPVHVVFCLDFSGSMRGDGITSLRDAIKFIFGDEAAANMIQFSEKDKIDIIRFNEDVRRIAFGSGSDGKQFIDKVNSTSPYGGTSLYPSVVAAYNYLKDESDEYNVSIIVMTDGEGNIGHLDDVIDVYEESKREIPIYSITFGSASESQLISLATLSNGKVFDGRTDLIKAFKTVREYN